MATEAPTSEAFYHQSDGPQQSYQVAAVVETVLEAAECFHALRWVEHLHVSAWRWAQFDED